MVASLLRSSNGGPIQIFKDVQSIRFYSSESSAKRLGSSSSSYGAGKVTDKMAHTPIAQKCMLCQLVVSRNTAPAEPAPNTAISYT